MVGDGDPAGAADPVDEAAQLVVTGAVAEVDPHPRAEPDRAPVPRRGGHLLAAEDEQAGALDPAPVLLGGDRVVVGGDDEVEAGENRPGAHLGGGLLAVGVLGVEMEVAAVPAGDVVDRHVASCGRNARTGGKWSIVTTRVQSSPSAPMQWGLRAMCQVPGVIGPGR